MEAEEILVKARTTEALPQGWIVFPLSRNKVKFGIVGWILGALLGLGLTAVLLPVVVPYNYQHGVLIAVLTTLLLGVFLFVGFGSIWALMVDVYRLVHADKHLIVITPESFVKQEGGKVIQVPLAHVRYVTARGKRPVDRTPSTGSGLHQVPNLSERVMGLFFGGNATKEGVRWQHGRVRTPTSLAFIDTRTDSEVTVVEDDVYGDPFMIAALLKQYAAAV